MQLVSTFLFDPFDEMSCSMNSFLGGTPVNLLAPKCLLEHTNLKDINLLLFV